jgi:hypothetical protein
MILRFFPFAAFFGGDRVFKKDEGMIGVDALIS